MTFTPGTYKEIIVTSGNQLSGTLDSSSVYVIDGVIDMGGDSIKVPSTGLNIRGLGFGISKLISSATGYTMFTTDGVTYSGNLFLDKIEIEVTGTTSKVYDLDNEGNFGAIEQTVVNYNNCTSLGNLANYRQGLELNTGRFGGTPTLTFDGTWSGGYRCTTSITRSLDSGMTTALFAEGTGFTMGNRFLTDMNCDLPALAPFCDFQSSNFINPSTLQIEGAIISRDGVTDANDTNIFPNITSSNIASSFRNNQGVTNTYVGGENTISTEIQTNITASGVYVTLAGTYTTSNLQHFDSPANGSLRHLGNNPREFRFIGDINIDGGANNDLSVRIRKWDNSTSTFETVYTQNREVNNFSGGRDVAFFTLLANVILDQNDYVFLEIANNSDTTNVTAELDSFFLVQER